MNAPKLTIKRTHRPNPVATIALDTEGGSRLELTWPANDLAESARSLSLAFLVLVSIVGQEAAVEQFRELEAQLATYQATLATPATGASAGEPRKNDDRPFAGLRGAPAGTPAGDAAESRTSEIITQESPVS